MKLLAIISAICILSAAGCGHPSYEAGGEERDAYYNYDEADDPQASSLFEMTFGDGDPKVIKNLPADAVNKLGDAVRSAGE